LLFYLELLSGNLLDIGFHEHLSEFKIFLHVLEPELHRHFSILVFVLDFLYLSLLYINLSLYLLILECFIVNSSLDIIHLFD
jgi:hypothetical protein